MRPLLPSTALVLLTLAGPGAFSRHGIQLGQPRRGNSCGASKDMVVRALEELRPDSPKADLQRANEDLRRATDLCSDTADAFYYRALVEEKLGEKPRADAALKQARLLDSEALREALNPFVLATPLLLAANDSRGIGASLPAASAAHPITATPVATAPRKWALIIGVSEFSDPSVHRLNYTLQDATELAAVLKNPKIGHFEPDNVLLLTNAQATTKNIKAKLNEIARQAQPNDLVLIYVATHGSPRTLDQTGGVNYLLTYDTELYRAGKFDEDGMYATAFPMVELANAVATRMKALKTVVILDTCYSGGAASAQVAATARLKDGVASQEMISRMGLGTGRIIISASGADEESYESPKLGHGYFTYYLLEALKTSKPGTPVTQLFASVSQNVTTLASASKVAQHPTIYQGADNADFAIADASP